MLLEALLVTFREGLEAFLIVGVIIAYLRKTGRVGLVRGVRIGLVISIFTCSIGAYLWTEVPNQPLYEGCAALAAAVLVGGLLWQMTRMAGHLKGDIEKRVARAAGDSGEPPSRRAVWAVALITALLVTREGLEAVLFLGVQAFSAKATTVAIGATVGFAAAGALAWFWSRYSNSLNVALVLKVTAIFLALFLVQLLVYGVHELAESGTIEGSQAFHDATERFGPDGDIGKLMAYSLCVAPFLYLLLNRRRSAHA